MRNTMRHFAVAISLMLAMTLPSFSQQHPIVEKDYVAYLFTYFTGNHISEEAVCYAVSMDGYTYWALNDGKPVLDSKVISSTGGVRDPHILRSQDGHTFYMVVTDMVSDNGWDSNRAMVLLKSNDLVNWTHSIINMQKRYKGQEKLKRVWAPQTVFDPEVGKYMVYWSMQYAGGADIIYYAYANDDFTDLIGEPKPLFIPENKKSCIDGDIVYKDMPRQMLALMLHDTGGETFHHFLVLLPILIPISHTNRFRARHFLVYTRQAQAAFLHSYFLLATFQKLGINQRTLETLAFREVISHHITVYNHQTDRPT